MSCPKCGPSRVMSVICPTCGGRLNFGDPSKADPRESRPILNQSPMLMQSIRPRLSPSIRRAAAAAGTRSHSKPMATTTATSSSSSTSFDAGIDIKALEGALRRYHNQYVGSPSCVCEVPFYVRTHRRSPTYTLSLALKHIHTQTYTLLYDFLHHSRNIGIPKFNVNYRNFDKVVSATWKKGRKGKRDIEASYQISSPDTPFARSPPGPTNVKVLVSADYMSIQPVYAVSPSSMFRRRSRPAPRDLSDDDDGDGTKPTMPKIGFLSNSGRYDHLSRKEYIDQFAMPCDRSDCPKGVHTHDGCKGHFRKDVPLLPG